MNKVVAKMYLNNFARRNSCTGFFFKVVVLFSFLLLGSLRTQAQLYPVLVTTQLIPPYSVYLSDYATPGNDKFRLVILQRDFSKPSYQIRLRLSIMLNGSLVLRTSPLFNPAPIHLDAGGTVISGIDLQPYVDSRNLDFIGISRDDYERTKTLPEGNYQICFTAYDYGRQDIQVSDAGCSVFWLSKDEPPLINFPACGAAVPVKTPTQIIFSWLPRNTSSVNSAGDTEYEFSLYETRPAGRIPNDVVLTSQPIYRTTTALTQLVFGPSEPLLFENMQYVWRVKAIDKNGKDQFRNNGYSEACTFTYGGSATTNSNVELEAVQNLQVKGKAARRGQASWTAQQVDGYKIYYKKKGSSNEWFSQQVQQDSTSIFDLDADTEYETRVQAYVGATYGPYSDIEKFKTLKTPVPVCGDSVPKPKASGLPLPFAQKGMIIDVNGIEMTINEVQPGKEAGMFKGKGEVSIPYFGGAVFNVVFDNLFVDGTRTAIRGRVDFITKKMDDFIKDELEDQKKQKLAEQQDENREQWKGTDFYDKVVYYKDVAIDSMYEDEDGNVVMTGDDGKIYVNKDIPTILADAPSKAIIIEDKNGNQWVVQKDGKITKVPGGGLSPTMDVVVSKEATDFVTRAFKYLTEVEYSGEAMTDMEEKSKNSDQDLDAYYKKRQDEIIAIQQEIIAMLETSPGANIPDSAGVAEYTFIDSNIDFSVENMNPLNNDQIENQDPELLNLSMISLEIKNNINRGKMVGAIANVMQVYPDQAASVVDLLGRELMFQDKHISEYLTDRKKDNAPDDVILKEVEQAIKIVIDNAIKALPIKADLQQLK